jgi:hypothetical protein
MNIKLLFSDYFDIKRDVLDSYGALNISIDADLPLFIDPFLLFSSKKPKYVDLHDRIVNHLVTLKNIAIKNQNVDVGLFRFPEVKQNWLGFSKWGNSGRGLGPQFANSLIKTFKGFYSNFGDETVSSSSHIEKLTLVGAGIGRDFISDFTANIMLEFFLEYSQEFALKYLREEQRKKFSVRCIFNSELKIWIPRSFVLPYFYLEDGDYILLTPLDILTKDEAFICHRDLISQFRMITNALENKSLRNAINHYFQTWLPEKPKKKDIDKAISETIQEYPEILDYYIRHQENRKDQAVEISAKKREEITTELISKLPELLKRLEDGSKFFDIMPTSYESALERVYFLKDVIENNDGYTIFYNNGIANAPENTIQRIFRLTWFASSHDINSEVNNGRGPADYKISYGARDSAIVEFKLASSSSLKRNLRFFAV